MFEQLQTDISNFGLSDIAGIYDSYTKSEEAKASTQQKTQQQAYEATQQKAQITTQVKGAIDTKTMIYIGGGVVGLLGLYVVLKGK